MAKKEISLKTKRLKIQPTSDEELRKLIERTEDLELKGAYKEMLAGCETDPENRLWYTAWKITLKNEETVIGDMCFKGPAKNYAVEIGYGILKEYEGNGYATEAVKAVVEWAFGNEDVHSVEAETAPDNQASQKILQKVGFKPNGEGEEGPRFVKEREPVSWLPIYMCFGVAIGTALGTATDNMGMCLSLGICIGLCIGAAMDASAKKRKK